jgi:ribosome-associated translation inhibitor RaiA
MVLNKYIRAFLAASGFLLFVFCFSCDEVDIALINCNECTVEEPTRAQLELKLERLGKYALSNSTIYITVYEGNLEDGVVFKSLQTTNYATDISVPLNKDYTVTAKYYIDGNDYIAVDSATPQVKYDKNNCDEPCYYVTNKSVNLRLRYTK